MSIHSTPDSKKNQSQVGAIAFAKRHSIYVEAVLVTLVFLLPVSVHAGVFSQLADLFAPETAKAVSVASPEFTVETAPLLSAATNANPQAVGGGEVTVMDGSLVASGPVGEDVIAAAKLRNTGEISVYTVRDGDALSYIAEMYGVTTNTIIWANDLSGASDIQPGQTLVILPIAGVQHTVKDGDTLSSIIKKYDADLEEVLDYNNLSEDVELVVGESLILPGASIKRAPAKAAATPVKSSGGSGGSWLSHPAPGSIRTQGVHGYNGVDLAAGYGSGIRAAAGGEVIVAKATGWNGGYGAYVVIMHSNGVQTLYAHMSEVYVGVGQWVSSGSTIGTMGNSGRSTGTHLHFEVRGGSNPF